jgi:small neutral amino acid transporter SnatA (MarC family)
MSASRPRKEVKMTKARLIYLTALLCMMVFYFQGFMRLSFLGVPGSWFEGH